MCFCVLFLQGLALCSPQELKDLWKLFNTVPCSHPKISDLPFDMLKKNLSYYICVFIVTYLKSFL
jgi:hypothetical protein